MMKCGNKLTKEWLDNESKSFIDNISKFLIDDEAKSLLDASVDNKTHLRNFIIYIGQRELEKKHKDQTKIAIVVNAIDILDQAN